MLAKFVASLKRLFERFIAYTQRNGDTQYLPTSHPPSPIPSHGHGIHGWYSISTHGDIRNAAMTNMEELLLDPTRMWRVPRLHDDDESGGQLPLFVHKVKKPAFCCNISKELAEYGVHAANDWQVPNDIDFSGPDSALLLEFYRQRQKSVPHKLQDFHYRLPDEKNSGSDWAWKRYKPITGSPLRVQVVSAV